MRPQRTREPANQDPVQLGPEIADRMDLHSAPDESVVTSFVMTRGASRAWEAINRNLSEARGRFFWIEGAAGSGKTHFLNYVVALAVRAGAPVLDDGRHLTIPIAVETRVDSAELALALMEKLAFELAGDTTAGGLWRELRGPEALRIMLDGARRQGVKSVTYAIDMGSRDASFAADLLESLAEITRSLKSLRLTVVAAGRSAPPSDVLSFQVAPGSNEESAIVAIGRARSVNRTARRFVDEAYRGVDMGRHDPAQFYPFAPSSIVAMQAVAAAVPELARIAHEAVEAWMVARRFGSLIYPADLLVSEEMRKQVGERLGEDGRSALKMAHSAISAMAERYQPPAHVIVDTLLLHGLEAEASPLGLEDLWRRIGESGSVTNLARLVEVANELARSTRGIVAFDSASRSLRFNSSAAGVPELAAYNSALPLLRRFDLSLTSAEDMPGLRRGHEQLGRALARAFEGAHRNRELLQSALADSGARLTPAHQKQFDDFIALAGAGVERLIETAADPLGRDQAMRIVTYYERIAEIATAVPELRRMRQFLNDTGISPIPNDEPRSDPRLNELEVQFHVVKASTDPAVLLSAARNFDWIQATFEKFKWSYVQYYRTAHDRWRIEMERLAFLEQDAGRYTQALQRLNELRALGEPEGVELQSRLASIAQRIVRCDPAAVPTPEIYPRCQACGYTIGTPSPASDLEDLIANLRRALDVKFVALSRDATARLIQTHDREHRLEGLLKIIQAAQTDALVRVLDDKLARYLGRLLDERHETAEGGRSVVHNLNENRLKRQSNRNQGPLKTPED